MPSENRLTAFELWKSIPGFEPGLPRQNSFTLPLVPPPLLYISIESISKSKLLLYVFSAPHKELSRLGTKEKLSLPRKETKKKLVVLVVR